MDALDRVAVGMVGQRDFREGMLKRKLREDR